MKAVVDGLELYAMKVKYGVYLKCDSCGATLDAPIENDRISANEHKLKQLAKSLGWTGNLDRQSTNDLCRECSKGD